MIFLYFSFAIYILFFLGLLVLTVVAFRPVPSVERFLLIMLWVLMVSAHLVMIFAVRDYFALAAAAYFLIGLSILGFAIPLRMARPTRLIRSYSRWSGALGTVALVYTTYTLAYFGQMLFRNGFERLDRFRPQIVFGLSILILVLAGAALSWFKKKTGLMIIGMFFFVGSGFGFMSFGVYTLPVALLFLMAALLLVAQESGVSQLPETSDNP